MQYRPKYYAVRVLQVAGALVALSGLAKIGSALINMDSSSHAVLFGAILLFVGVAVGIAASLLATYFESKMVNSNSDKIALDALNQLGEQYVRKRAEPADGHKSRK